MVPDSAEEGPMSSNGKPTRGESRSLRAPVSPVASGDDQYVFHHQELGWMIAAGLAEGVLNPKPEVY